MPRTSRTAFLLLITTGVGCRTTPRPPPTPYAATAVVSHFVMAETTGRAERAESLVDRKSCEGDGGWDFLAVTRSVDIAPPFEHLDTTIVPVTYHWAGRWWTDDEHQVGYHNTHFTAVDTADSVLYPIFTDSAGREWIGCGDFYEGHIGASRLVSEVPRFDTKSLVAWKAARLPVK